MRTMLAAILPMMLSSAALAQPPAGSVTLGENMTMLNVTAEGVSRRAPDLALFSAGVVTQGATASEAFASNSAQMTRVVDALKRAGVAQRDIQTAGISLQPRYSDPQREAELQARLNRQPYVPPAEPVQPRIIGYDARNSVQVRVRRMDAFGRIIDALVAAGANQVDGPSFTVNEPDAALDEARTMAMGRARQRAELYARAAGLRVARIISITEGGGYYPVQNIVVTAQAVGASAPPPPPPPTPVQPGELALGVTVSVQFALER